MSASNQRPMGWGEAWYWRLRKWMTPGLRNAQYAYFSLLEEHLAEGDRWLDLGCGRRIVPGWMKNGAETERRLTGRAGSVTGVDPDTAALHDNKLPIRKIHATAESVPEPDGSFDLITANMVFEHLEDPATVLRESARLLRPGGKILIHTPSVLYPCTLAARCIPAGMRTQVTAWLERRHAKDIYPTRYRMNRPARINSAAAGAGLDVVAIQRIADSPELIMLGPLVALELGLIAFTRTPLGRALSSNLIITLAKPAGQRHPIGGMKDREQAEQALLGAAA